MKRSVMRPGPADDGLSNARAEARAGGAVAYRGYGRGRRRAGPAGRYRLAGRFRSGCKSPRLAYRPRSEPAKSQARPQRADHRKTPVLRLRQQDRRPVSGEDVVRRRYTCGERHRRPTLAGGMASSVRFQWRPTTARPLTLAAIVDERGTQACPDSAEMTGNVDCRYYGGDFTTGKIALLRALITASPPPNRHALSREFCRRIGRFKPDGELKDMMARVTMLAMHKGGLIVLPPPKWPRPPRRRMVFGPNTEPSLFPTPTTLDLITYQAHLRCGHETQSSSRARRRPRIDGQAAGNVVSGPPEPQFPAASSRKVSLVRNQDTR